MPSATNQYKNIVITSLRGGLNNTDPAHILPEDQCTIAENVEFFFSAMGERRNGCAAMSLLGSGLDTSSIIVHLSQRFPTNDPTIGELWAVGATEDVSSNWAYRSNEDEWNPITPIDAPDTSAPYIFQITAQPFNTKHFFAYKTADSSVDRLHVWDGTVLRPTGLAQPTAAPVVTNEGSGSFSTTRYYRVRFTQLSGSVINLRSEPSDTTTFSPSGSGAGATIALPTGAESWATNWEIEASADNANFYILTSLPLATTTYNDTTADPNTYADGVLSEDIGQYLLQPAAKYLIVDSSRLIGLGHQTDPSRQSDVWWGPPSTDPGVGNDERKPLDTLASVGDNIVSLDNYEGGAITGVSQTVNGSFYIFKWSHIYQATATGSTPAYNFICLSKARGALSGSIVSGVDEYGRGCVYFLDPLLGPSRIGPAGIQAIVGLRKTWTLVNRLATKVVAHGVYYPEKYQMHWWVATDSANSPNLKLVLQVNQNQEDGDQNVIRGWSLHTGRIAEAYCSAIINVEILDAEGDIATIARRPYIGLDSPDLLQQCDLLSTDAGQSYMARIVTKPYIMAGLLNKWGGMTAALLTDASTDGNIKVTFTRDFGKESNSVEASLAPTPSNESLVLNKFDNLVMSSAYALQFEFSDPS